MPTCMRAGQKLADRNQPSQEAANRWFQSEEAAHCMSSKLGGDVSQELEKVSSLSRSVLNKKNHCKEGEAGVQGRIAS